MSAFTNLFRRTQFKLPVTRSRVNEESLQLLAIGREIRTAPAPRLYPEPGVLARIGAHVHLPGRFRHSPAASSQTMLHPFGGMARLGTGSTPLDDLPAAGSQASMSSKPAEPQPRPDALARLQHKLAASRQEAVAGLFAPASTPTSDGRQAAPWGHLHLATQQVAALFPGATVAAFEQLQVALHALPLPASADRSLIAGALASASGGNVVLARGMLQALASGLDLRLGARSGYRWASRIDAGAWKAAGLLARTDDGFTMLRGLHVAHVGFGRAARVLLQASSGSAVVPTSLAARAAQAASRMLTPGARLSNAEKASIFAWEQGFREDGEGSPLQAVRARLGKFVHKTIPRVKVSRFRSFLPRLLGKKKSPLSALGRGTYGTQRPSLKSERAAVGDALKTAAGTLYNHLVRDADAILDAKSPLTALAAVASMAYWQAQPATYPGQRIGVDEVPALALHMRQVLDRISSTQRWQHARKFAALVSATESLGRDPARILSAQPSLRRLLREPVSGKRLARWGKLRGFASADPFWQQLDVLGRRQVPASFQLKSRSIHAARQSLRVLIGSMEPGARLRLADGSTAGVSTKGLATNLSNLLHLSGVPVGGRLNLAASWGRRSVFEVAQNAIGGEILIGRERTHRRTRGLGVFLGYDFRLAAAKLRCGINADYESSREKRDFAGLSLRVLQRKCTDGSPDVERMKSGMQKVIAFMFDDRHRAIRGRAWNRDGQLFDRFAAAFFDDPDIALGFNQPSTVCTTRNVSLGASISAKLPGSTLRVGPGIGITAGTTALLQQDDGMVSDRLQEQSRRIGEIRELTLRAGLKGRFCAVAGDGPEQAPLGTGICDASLPEWIIPLYVSGSLARARLIRENGRLQARRCTLDIESSSIDGHVEVLDAERERWIAALAQQHAADPDPIARARTELETYLDEARHHARYNQRFIQRAHLREDIARSIDSHGAMVALIRENTHLPQAQRDRLCAAHEAACAALTAQPGAWMPLVLKVLEKSSSQTRLGLSAGIHLMAETTAEGEHQLACLKAC